MASFLNEDLMGTNLDIPEGEIKLDGKVNPVYADAINVHNKKKKEREKNLKDKKDELKKPFLGTKGNTTVMPKTKDMKKLKLSEDMFKSVREHMNDAPEAYDNIFRVIGNMEHIINYISELDEEELTYEDMKQSYDVLNDAMAEFEDYLFEIKEGERRNGNLKEDAAVMDRKAWEVQDKRNNKDMWSDIYNELVGMKGIEAPHRRLKTNDRYKASWGDNPDESDAIRVGASWDGGIVVKAEEESALDFAKEVAETYGVEWRMKEHTSRYADAKFELFIYPDRQVVTESLNESRNSKTVVLDNFDDKYVNSPEFLSAVTQIIGEYETFGGSVKQIKDFAITVTVDVGSDMTAGSYGCKFKALIDGDFDNDYISEQWVDFDLSRYDNLVYQCWWEKYDGEDEYYPTCDVITVYSIDVSSKIINAYLQVDGEAIMYMLEPIETALYDYVPSPDDK